MTRPSAAAVQKAGEILAAGQRAADQMTARELAEAAWTPTCGATVDELEDEIRQRRGLPLAHAS
ncbi:hypothetical protein [Aeromicrobium sp. 9AM]|uniref:hypothetical protein n=1 Tax=Aeromicrobium sp. 9AM TaxID=2653126 RepID=UPI0012F03F59|nr:hypothetical protein [Aeromicrobium sp. 9AM]VXB83399.1 conserved hypothetical protein [Aeromicrobium sp. 9AM]